MASRNATAGSAAGGGVAVDSSAAAAGAAAAGGAVAAAGGAAADGAVAAGAAAAGAAAAAAGGCVAPRTWAVTVTAIGAFLREEVEGTFRITAGDTVLFIVPAGSLVNQAECVLEISTTVSDEVLELRAEREDALGSRRFRWKSPAPACGTAECVFRYKPFPSRRLSTERAPFPPVEWTRSVVNRIVIDPRITIAGRCVPPTALVMQTQLARCLGKIDEWVDNLRVATADAKFNAIHLTPIQVPGESGSCYSLADCLSVSPELLPESILAIADEDRRREESWKLLQKTIHRIEHELKIICTSDVVLNHCASSSPWIRDHPDCGYCVDNSPHLRAAVELDVLLQKFSQDIVHGRFAADGLTANISSDAHVATLRLKLDQCLLRPFRMHEYFALDVERTVQLFNAAPAYPGPPHGESPNAAAPPPAQERLNKACLDMVGIARNNGVCPPGEVTRKVCADEQELRAMLGESRKFLEKACSQTVTNILDAIEGNVRWERLQCGKGPIGLSHWEGLVPRYFTPVRTRDDREVHLANNGWVMNWDAENDFAAPGTLVYLERALVVWSDCIKLRFGKTPEDAPYLWNLMTKYCEITAETFHGLRLDNCHSTPMVVAKHCLRAARRKNPSLWVYAELFTGKRSVDLKFERKLGLNALIREAMQCFSPRDLAWHVKDYGGNRVGALDPRPALRRYGPPARENGTDGPAAAAGSAAAAPAAGAAAVNGRASETAPAAAKTSSGKPFSGTAAAPGESVSGGPGAPPSPYGGAGAVLPLRPLPPPNLFYDCTHDNETPQQKRTAADALSNAVAVCASVCATGSVRGYDELVPRLLSVVNEKRRYHAYNSGPHACTEGARTTDDLSPMPAAPPRVVLRTTAGTHFEAVVVRGSWNGWGEGLEMTRADPGPAWELQLPPALAEGGRFEFKFVGNGGTWFHDLNLPHTKDDRGNINNVFLPESDAGSVDCLAARSQGLKDAVDPCTWRPGMPLPGLLPIRSILNELHARMAMEGFTEIAVDSPQDDLFVVTRHCPVTHRRILFVVRTAFTHSQINNGPGPAVSLELRDVIDKVILEAQLEFSPGVSFVDEPDKINGLPSRLLHASNVTVPEQQSKGSLWESPLRFCTVANDAENSVTRIRISHLLPGGIIILSTKGTLAAVTRGVAQAVAELPVVLSASNHPGPPRGDELQALSYLLYSCNSEEMDRSRGTRGCYQLEQVGALAYAGIAGVVPYFDKLRKKPRDDASFSHPLFRNIVAGDWLFEYLADRLDCEEGAGPASDDGSSTQVLLIKCAAWMRETFAPVLRAADRQLLPSFIDWAVSALYAFAFHRVIAGFAEPIRFAAENDDFVARLALATLQFYSYVPSSPLVANTHQPSISAGLPHFAVEYMRAWGRDTFIALKGILLVAGRFEEAKTEILGFARLVRHALIPNLLDSGNNPRYNARDATFWFLQAVCDFYELAPPPAARALLLEKVAPKYTDFEEGSKVETVADLVHYILSRHASGISFRELNAGPKIDSQMTDAGFNVSVRRDPETGLLFGGNRHNCGTWMDKMGSSLEAGNKGVPATPRDGAPIEIAGLLKSVLRFVNSLPADLFPYKEAVPGVLTYADWETTLAKSFEPYYYIPLESEEAEFYAEAAQQVGGDLAKFKADPQLINKRGIFKDTVGQCDRWRDYQLRPNFFTALAVAPELAAPKRTAIALQVAEEFLLALCHRGRFERRIEQAQYYANSTDAITVEHRIRDKYGGALFGLQFTAQLGAKTLDPDDLNYRPIYNNEDNSTDFSVAHGFSYHNGPEWVWPLGHFLDALFKNGASSETGGSAAGAKFRCMRILMRHRQFMATDPWLSLPELTNANGAHCPFSCSAQAWSIGTLLAFLHTAACSKKGGVAQVRG